MLSSSSAGLSSQQYIHPPNYNSAITDYDSPCLYGIKSLCELETKGGVMTLEIEIQTQM